MEKKTNVKALAGIFIFAIAAMASNMTMGLLASISKSYAAMGVAGTTVSSILVGPALIGTLYAFVVGTLNQKISAKYLLIVGQIGMLLYGLIFFLMGGKASIILLIIASGFVGLNQGSMNTLIGILLVNVVPDESKRGGILGIITAVMNVGGVVITTLGGMISAASGEGNWNKAYVLFFYFIVAIVADLFLLPNTEPEGKKAPAENGPAAPEAKVGLSVWLLSAHYFFFFLFLYVFGTNCAGYIALHGLGGDGEAGFAASTITIGGVIAGLTYGFFSKLLGKLTVPFCMALATIGLAIPVLIQTSIVGIYLAGILCGFGMMGANPYIIATHLPKIAPGPAYGKAMSVFAGFMNAGMVVAIYVIAFLTKIAFGDADNIDGKFIVAMVGMIITTVLSLPVYLAKTKEQ